MITSNSPCHYAQVMIHLIPLFMRSLDISSMTRLLFISLILIAVTLSCEPGENEVPVFNNDVLTIGEYIKANKEQYSKSHQLLIEGEMLITLCGYNPYGDGYTLFLPTNEAIDQFVQQHPVYDDLEEMLQDTTLTKILTRYHTVNNRVHSNDFPDGALKYENLTGNRLTIGIYTKDDGPWYLVNNVAPIIQSNLKMTNGYIHVISEVLQEDSITGYEWLQQHDDYSILAGAMELVGFNKGLWNKYTILAEPDSIYQKNGISGINDLIDRYATPGIPYTDNSNDLFQFTAFHILRNDYYLNDFNSGSNNYRTKAEQRVTIDAGIDIRILPGIDTFEIHISEAGDTTFIDYISPIMGGSNIRTYTGPIHPISGILDNGSF